MAKTTTPIPSRTSPDVWTLPRTGAEWCDCGEHHPVDLDLVRSMIERSLGQHNNRIEHREICRVLMEMWRYEEVCDFFHDAVCYAAETCNGEVDADYPINTGEEIIAYFSKTWNGCPVEACEGSSGKDRPR